MLGLQAHKYFLTSLGVMLYSLFQFTPWAENFAVRGLIVSIGGHSSAGRAQASQAWGRGFDPRCPLQ